MRSRSLLLAVPVAALALSACTMQPPAQPAPTPTTTPSVVEKQPVRHETADALGRALTERLRTDSTSSFEFTATGAAFPVSGTGVTRLEPAGSSTQMTAVVEVPLLPVESDVVATGGQVYVELPPAAGGDPAKPYVRVGPGGTDVISDALGPLVAVATSTDPAATVQTTITSGRITGITEDRVDGRPVLRYSLELPGTTGPLPATLVVDADDRVLTSTTTTLVGGAPVTVTTTHTGHGQPVEIVVPPAELVRG